MILSYDTIRTLVIDPLWEDGHVTDTASEYGEPGYSFDHDETPVFLIGDWWCRCGHNPHTGQYRGHYDDRIGPGILPGDLHDVAAHHPRLWAQLEAQGVEVAFYDEWTVIDDKAYRTQPDSYSWQPTILWNEDTGEWLTPDDDIETWIEWAVNNHKRCLMNRYRHDIEAAGFTQWEPHDPHRYHNGWHEGMDDRPETVVADINRWSDGQEDIVFVLDETSQFYVGFSAWTRPKEQDA